MRLEYAINPFRLEFECSGLPKMSNQLLRGHWGAKLGHANLWKRKIWREAWAFKPAKPLERAKLTLTRVSSVCPDYDGLVSCFKHPIDGLVEANVIAGDTFAHIGVPDYKWEKGPPGKGKIRIRVEELCEK